MSVLEKMKEKLGFGKKEYSYTDEPAKNNGGRTLFEKDKWEKMNRELESMQGGPEVKEMMLEPPVNARPPENPPENISIEKTKKVLTEKTHEKKPPEITKKEEKKETNDEKKMRLKKIKRLTDIDTENDPDWFYVAEPYEEKI